MIWLLLAAAAAQPDCNKVKSAIAQDQCELARSMTLDPAPNCVTRDTQFDMNICSFRDYLRADIELNRNWGAIKQRLAGASKAYGVMLAGQKAWLAYRDKQCEFWSGWYEGGSVAPAATNSCLLQITTTRANELGKQLKDLDH